MKSAKTTAKWQKTSVQNLVRHASGRYYARAYSGGKELWKSLKTSHFSVARARLAEFLSEHRKSQPAGPPEGSIKMTFAQALNAHLQSLADNPALKPATRHYWNQIFTSLLKSWPELAEREMRRLTATECREWMRKFRKGASATRFNNTISALRHVFDVAIEKGVIYANPAAKLKRLPIRSKTPTLPSRSQFFALVEKVENAGAWCSRDCADFLRGLAFTGCRKGEAAQIQWRDVEFKSGEIVIRGDAQTGTKNWTVRRVPLIPEARALFERMKSQRAEESPTEPVFRVREAQKAIDHAAKNLEMERITHHGLRHMFATICIESGVDIPTVSRWLGHKDGGALAMRTYGHLRREHSIAQAQKVRFDPVAQTAA